MSIDKTNKIQGSTGQTYQTQKIGKRKKNSPNSERKKELSVSDLQEGEGLVNVNLLESRRIPGDHTFLTQSCLIRDAL